MLMGLYHGPQTASSSALSYVPCLSHPFLSVAGFGDQFQDKHLVGEVSILRLFTAEYRVLWYEVVLLQNKSDSSEMSCREGRG